MTEDVQAQISVEIMELTGLTHEELESRTNLLLICELYHDGKVSLSKAARLANMKIDEYLEAFGSRHFKRKPGVENADNAEFELRQAMEFLE